MKTRTVKVGKVIGDSRPVEEEQAAHKWQPTFSQRYLMGFTKLYYYLGIIPFSFSLKVKNSPPQPPSLTLTWSHYSPYENNGSDKTYVGLSAERKVNIFQKLFCIVNHGLLVAAFGFLAYSLRYQSPSDEGQGQSLTEAALTIIGPVLALYFLFTAWSRGRWFEWLLMELSSSSSASAGLVPVPPPTSHFETFQNWFAIISPVLFTLLNFYTQLSHPKSPISQLAWSTGSIPTLLKNLFILLTYFVSVIVGHTTVVIFQLVALAFRDKCGEFIHFMKEEIDKGNGDNGGTLRTAATADVKTILQKYFQLESFANGVSGRFGGWIITNVILTAPYYSQRLVDLIKGRETAVGALLTALHLSVCFFWLLTTAYISNQVSDIVKAWLVHEDNYAKLSNQQLTMLMGKVNQEGVALRGSNFFTVSYPFIGTLISLIITYAYIDQHS